MTRLPLASTDQQPEAIRQFVERRGNLNVLRLLANAPNVFGGWSEWVGEIFASATFSARLREVIILRVGQLQNSPYELAQHVGLARAAGLSEQQIDALAGTGDLDAAGFSSTERTVIDTVTELCTTHRLSDDTFVAAHALLGDEALTELLMIVSCYYGLALVLNATDLEIDATARFLP
jgi:4-carboxymuconolactone decarboxylase